MDVVAHLQPFLSALKIFYVPLHFLKCYPVHASNNKCAKGHTVGFKNTIVCMHVCVCQSDYQVWVKACAKSASHC